MDVAVPSSYNDSSFSSFQTFHGMPLGTYSSPYIGSPIFLLQTLHEYICFFLKHIVYISLNDDDGFTIQTNNVMFPYR